MLRKIEIEIDRGTWPAIPNLPAFPPSFHHGLQQVDIDLAAMLQELGRLTTPPSTHGITLAEYWAFVRYFSAVTADNELRLTEDFSKLDAHQKTILSDDFGMGIPMYWLEQQLGPLLKCDGRYFIESVASAVGASPTNISKRGPNKSPDFVALDGQGVWHVIECKGTQSGTNYRDRQLFGSNTVAGAVQQKVSITFPTGHTGQRLACGLVIGIEGKSGTTNLKIVDPPVSERAFEVREEYLEAAADTVLRSTLAVSLRLAGFQTASYAVASPIGPSPASRKSTGSNEDDRKSFVESRREGAATEIRERQDRSIFYSKARRYYGRQLILDLPRPLATEKGFVRTIRVRQGVSAEFLNLLAEENFPDTRIVGSTLGEKMGMLTTRIEREDDTTQLFVGDIFFSRVDLPAKERSSRDTGPLDA
jgi:hypothetical protein